METLRWILLLIGVLLILGIVLWGYLSHWAGRRGKRGHGMQPARHAARRPAERLAPRGMRGARREVEELPADLMEQELDQLRDQIAGQGEPAAVPRSTDRKAAQSLAPDRGVEEEPRVFVIHVVATSGNAFAGSDILRTMKQAGLVYGEMRIFHRYASEAQNAGPIFSVANIVKPGWFDLSVMASFSTPGLSFFMKRPGPWGGRTAFDGMLGAARHIANTLGGELQDQNYKPLRPATIARLRAELQAEDTATG
jgi:cell division protein ZipA